MAALDTNILIRFLVEDDAAQLAAARKLIAKCLRSGQALYIPVTVSSRNVSSATGTWSG